MLRQNGKCIGCYVHVVNKFQPSLDLLGQSYAPEFPWKPSWRSRVMNSAGASGTPTLGIRWNPNVHTCSRETLNSTIYYIISIYYIFIKKLYNNYIYIYIYILMQLGNRKLAPVPGCASSSGVLSSPTSGRSLDICSGIKSPLSRRAPSGSWEVAGGRVDWQDRLGMDSPTYTIKYVCMFCLPTWS